MTPKRATYTKEEALEYHENKKGKIEVLPKDPVKTFKDQGFVRII